MSITCSFTDVKVRKISEIRKQNKHVFTWWSMFFLLCAISQISPHQSDSDRMEIRKIILLNSYANDGDDDVCGCEVAEGKAGNKAVAKKESWKNMAKCCLCWKILLTFAS